MTTTAMNWRVPAYAICFALLLCPNTRAEEQPPPQDSPRPAFGSLLGLGDLSQSAADLKAAGEAFEQFGGSLEVLASSLAEMSSEFDPFGYKTAFRTIGQQAEIIERQHQRIQELQQKEIDRLRKELQSTRRGKLKAPAKKRKQARKPSSSS